MFLSTTSSVQSSDWSYLRFSVQTTGATGAFANIGVSKSGISPETLVVKPDLTVGLTYGSILGYVFDNGLSTVRVGIIDPSQVSSIVYTGSSNISITGDFDMRDLENMNLITPGSNQLSVSGHPLLTSISQPLKPVICSDISIINNDLTGHLNLDNLVGLRQFQATNNPNLTSIGHTGSTGVFVYNVFSCDLTGNHDLTMFPGLGGQFQLHLNPNLTSIGHTGSTQTFTTYTAYQCGLSGNHDLTMFPGLGGDFQIYQNPNLTSIGHTGSTQIFSSYLANLCGLTSNHDLTMFPGLGGNFQINQNPNLTSIGHTGSTQTFTIYSVFLCDLTGNHDLTMFPGLGGDFLINQNFNLTSIGHTGSTQTFTTYYAYNCDLTGNHDLTMFPNLGGDFRMQFNLNLTSIGHTGSTQTFTAYYANSCDLTGNHDLTMFPGLGGDFRISDNTNLTSIGHTGSTQTFTAYYANSCNISFVDFTLFPNMTNVNNSNIRLQNNSMSTANVNQILVDLDSISTSGFTGRIITINGTNAAPTSGPPDGLTAKSSLITKGFTVTTN
jgi:hypothetical protein